MTKNFYLPLSAYEYELVRRNRSDVVVDAASRSIWVDDDKADEIQDWLAEVRSDGLRPLRIPRISEMPVQVNSARSARGKAQI